MHVWKPTNEISKLIQILSHCPPWRSYKFINKTYELQLLFYFILKIVFIFRERGSKGEREGEKHLCVRKTLTG